MSTFCEWPTIQEDRADEVGALTRALMAGFFDVSSVAMQEALRRARQEFERPGHSVKQPVSLGSVPVLADRGVAVGEMAPVWHRRGFSARLAG